MIVDSQAPIGMGKGVYVSAVAKEMTGAALEQGIEIFSRSSVVDGAGEWTRKDVRSPAQPQRTRATL